MKLFISCILYISIAFSCKSKSANEQLMNDIKEASARNVKAYNELEEDKARAVQEGDIATAAVLQASMDSIMISNAKLGDSLNRLKPAE
jgi:magnesium-transporting ATPase (P-type)